MSLHEPVRLFVNKNTSVTSNLVQEFVRIRAAKEPFREAIVAALCRRTFKTRTLVFVRSKNHAHRLRIIFGLMHLRAGELHGKLTQAQVWRRRILRQRLGTSLTLFAPIPSATGRPGSVPHKPD